MRYQEMANPRVRPHLSFYPEDAGKHLSEARQASRWLSEIPNEDLAPMARIDKEDYYIFEPAMLYGYPSESVCMPYRWFTRAATNGTQIMYAKCWKLVLTPEATGWNVVKTSFIVREDQFLHSFPKLVKEHQSYGLPDPRNIVGKSSSYGSCLRHRLI